MLRASVELQGGSVDLRSVVGDAEAGQGVPDAKPLVAFAEAAVAGQDDVLEQARQDVQASMGEAALVDTAGIVANFQRMVRIADATGIPLDAPMEAITADLRDELGLDGFGSAANTPTASGAQAGAGRILGAAVRGAMRSIGAARRWRRGD